MKLIGNKMRFFNKKKKFPTEIFVTVSLLSTFFLFIILYVSSSFFYYNFRVENKVEDNYSHNYYDYHDTTDPFITKNPNLREKVTKPVISNKDPVLGRSDAPITIVQFSDFECGVCSDEEDKIRNLMKGEYGDKIRLIWKDFPMIDTGSVSWKASLAARCAQAQNKFWEYHDLLYSNNQNLNRGLYIDLARKSGLDLDDFLDCYDSRAGEKMIKENVMEATDLELPGIPYFYINDQEFLGEISESDLKKIIDIEVKKYYE